MIALRDRPGRLLVDRHAAPAEERLALLADRPSRGCARTRSAGATSARQEDHADAVGARARAARCARSCASRRRNSSGICTRMPAPSPVSGSQPHAPRCVRLRRTVEPLLDDVVRALALHVDDEADAARVVLVPSDRGASVVVRCSSCSWLSAQRASCRCARRCAAARLPPAGGSSCGCSASCDALGVRREDDDGLGARHAVERADLR